MTHEKYIFLDFDGVLNTERYISALRQDGKNLSDSYGYLFDDIAVAHLGQIIEQTGACIVISSSWKLEGLDKMLAMWRERELPGEVVDVTSCTILDMPLLEIDPANADLFVGRGREIAEWLKNNAAAGARYVILDDVPDFFAHQHKHFVEVDPRVGITAGNAERAIEILNQ